MRSHPQVSAVPLPLRTAPDAPRAAPARGSQTDHSGRTRIVWNVLFGWGAYGVYIVAGFVLPRFIDDRLGQQALGVWDFAWSMVSYFALAQAGIGSSVNRYFAGQRATGDIEGMRTTASTLTAMLCVVALLVVGLAFAAAAVLPWLAHGRVEPHLIGDARWVVVLLGMNLAVQQLTEAYNAVLTGSHRWDLYTGINSACYTLTVIAMCAALALGGGLVSLGVVTLLGTAVTQTIRAVASYRVCPELRIRPAYVRLSTARSLVSFGGKVFLPRIAELLMEQTISFLVWMTLGAGALAVFSRPRGLLRHSASLVGRLAFVLEPVSGSLQASGNAAELRTILIRMSSAGALVALPITILLLILGDSILTCWMGDGYAVGPVLTALALGSLFSVAQLPVHSVLIGMNAHGRVGIAKFLASLTAVGLAWLLMCVLNFGLLGAALAVALPMIAVGGLYVPLRACALLGIPVGQYVRGAWIRPLLFQLPFAICLLTARMLITQWSVVTLIAAITPAGVALLITYWFGALPRSLREKLLFRARRLRTGESSVHPG